MSEFSAVVFSTQSIRVARWLAGNTYDSMSYILDMGAALSVKVIADNDILESYGLDAASLTVIRRIEGTLRQGAIDPPVLWVTTGTADSSSGTTPNRVATSELIAGGSGLPYFGIIGDFASENGGNVLLGLRKCMLDSYPSWTVETNKFRVEEVGFKAFVADTTTRKLHKSQRYETATAIPVDFNSFFGS